eukprot:CAMPEP_0114650586 /NCGR_PEP_ID=MMETSP0191-20121206/7765_1 /TAXON_ID=126664 /ORGANISM="Sorites sp." /LENGTH=38 /DNA_ID= /DNA_START= /DNA_END= /DNA_ORIENTATION=
MARSMALQALLCANVQVQTALVGNDHTMASCGTATVLK